MKINGFFLFLLLFLLFILLSSIYYPLRYLKYLLPLIPLFFYTNRKSLQFDKRVANYYYTLLLFYCFAFAYLLIQNSLNVDISTRFLPNVVFVLTPLLYTLLILPLFDIHQTHRYISIIFLINIGIFFYDEGTDFIRLVTDLQVLRNAIFSSELITENHLAFVFGFLVIFFMIEKFSKWYKILALIFLILCFKRIVIVAVLLCWLVYVLLSILRLDLSRDRIVWSILGVLLNFVFIKIVHLLVSDTFDDYILDKTGYSTDQFLMGRKTFYSAAFEEVGSINWFGTGLGKMDDIIFASYGERMNLHSEILKNYFEFGVILFSIWLFILFYKSLFSNKAAIFLIYLNVLMLTDNVFIYFDIMFYFYFFILIFLNQRNAKTNLLNNS